MRIVLLEDVAILGRVGSVVEVKAGYARNYLIPFKKAKGATSKNLKAIEEQRVELNRLQAERLEKARALSAQLEEVGSLKIAQQAGIGGRLFGSVTAQRIIAELSSLGHIVPKGSIQMPETSIRQLGRYKVEILLHPDVIVFLGIEVVSVSIVE